MLAFNFILVLINICSLIISYLNPMVVLKLIANPVIF